MTHTQKIDAILTAIRNTPGLEHLKELSFGCEVACSKYEVVGKVYLTGDRIEAMFDDTMDAFEIDSRHFKIIGHPVQWSDVLVAMDRKTEDFGFILQANGVIAKHREGAVTKVNLTPNPEQSMQQDPELTDFLYELIVKE